MRTPKYQVPNRSLSPLRGSTAAKPKYYSSDEVNKIVRSCFEPKIQFLMGELEERQQIIARLNNKLNENDKKLLEQSSIIDNYIKRQKQVPNLQGYIVATVNQIVNDKLKQHWEVLSAQIKKVSEKIGQKYDAKRLQVSIQAQMDKIRTVLTTFMETNKQKSNSYWQKIKDALNKINAKIVATEKDLFDISTKIEEFQNARVRDREIVQELQAAKGVVKNLVQLKKSVENIYENYQIVLNLQKGLKQTLEEQNTDSMWQQGDFYRNKKKNVLPQEIIGLDYSKDQVSDVKFESYNPIKTQPPVSPIKTNTDKSLSVDLVQLQRTAPFGKFKDHSELFSLNTSENQVNSRIQNNTLLINLSLQTRKEMGQGVRERLLELIEIKHWPKPLQVRYDEQINYLKNSQGNYLFDIKGNMFKVTPQELKRLQEERIVARGRKDHTSPKIKMSHC